jgi:HTH-type transcriptional regulator/antitoxin HigA
MHEIGHIICHWERGLQDGFFDDETATVLAGIEREADVYAQNALLPDEVWKSSFVQFSKSKDQVTEFAIRNRIGRCIVAGRIRRERKDYSIFSDLVGHGEVKKLIYETEYSEP